MRVPSVLSLGVAGDHRQTGMAQTNGGHPRNTQRGCWDYGRHWTRSLYQRVHGATLWRTARGAHGKGRRCLLLRKRIRVHVRQIEPFSTVLGRIAEAVPETAAEEFKLSAGDRLMLYSDGLTDVWNGNDEILGVEGLEKIVRKAATASLHDMREAVIQGVNLYSAGPLRDDVTLILAEIR